MSDIEIARAATLRPMEEIAAKLDIPASALEPYGRSKAKIANDYVASLSDKPFGKLVLVTAISPTAAGEGKTTTTVGLGDAMNKLGKKTTICLREPSLGPCFGMKGGAAGGGHAQVVPMEDINLHFTGDLHAITAAHNLLSAMIDNHIYWGNELGIDQRRIVWRRVVDMNDRALRSITTGLGGVTNGYPTESGFDITVASEVMAILCLAESLEDLQERLGKIVIAYKHDKTAVTCKDLKADGAMAVLLKEAFQPNLVQTLENNPALIHGGPFANIAHGCNSVIATKTALRTSDFTVTEAGFGADLGAEKFFDIKCRQAGLTPDAVVLVATIRALKMHGGVAKADLGNTDVEALKKGSANLARHILNVKQFGLPVVVALNRFSGDSAEEMQALQEITRELGVETIICEHWAKGSEGALDLARHVTTLLESTQAQFAPLYRDDLPILEKVKTIATRIYRADEITAAPSVKSQLKKWEAEGYGHLPVCIAKTPYSFSTDQKAYGAPTGHTLDIRSVRLCAGAGFIVVLTGEVLTMPGLPRHPAAETIGLDANGNIEGLF
ncbi:formate--tetrahydrofolate ligase [Rhodobacteraceae bacterium RKSG542]|uniref:formate--tetrahydrofolate ligase n=1 Tax=Pseudovibrio flavus TaxID=2529854 RepID=UPI0012BD0D4E|nr:formate--tetrahydrofolate ligase [Pseudovibrio flavus]MTI17584.1 formate--tetrahydrofolate ligase [Pseudovibrio flavus]